MGDLIGDGLVATSDWLVDAVDSPLFVPGLLIVVLAVIVALVRLWRWAGWRDAQDEQRKRDALPNASRSDDV